MDYTKTFSFVFKTSTIQIILAMAVHLDWEIRQLDVSNALLHGNLIEKGFICSSLEDSLIRKNQILCVNCTKPLMA